MNPNFGLSGVPYSTAQNLDASGSYVFRVQTNSVYHAGTYTRESGNTHPSGPNQTSKLFITVNPAVFHPERSRLFWIERHK